MSIQSKINFLFFANFAVAPLSVIGSFLTLVTISREKQRGGILNTYHRLVIGIAVFDLFSSVALSFGTLPMPAVVGEIMNLPPGIMRGNLQTCTAQGFFIFLGMGSFCYSAMLMVYYVLVIRYSLNDLTISKRIEPFMHLVPIGFYLSVGIFGLVRQVFNAQFSFCYLGGWPYKCQNNQNVECERGGPGTFVITFGFWFATVPFLLWVFILIVALLIVAITITLRSCQSTRFDFERQIGATRRRSTLDNNMRQVIIQCILYAVCFINVAIWTTSTIIAFNAGAPLNTLDEHFFVGVMISIFYPLQGLFLFLIFIRPRMVKAWQGSHRRCCCAFWDSVWNPRVNSRRRSSSVQRRRSNSLRSRPSISLQSIKRRVFGDSRRAEFNSNPTSSVAAAAAAAKQYLEDGEGSSRSDHPSDPIDANHVEPRDTSTAEEVARELSTATIPKSAATTEETEMGLDTAARVEQGQCTVVISEGDGEGVEEAPHIGGETAANCNSGVLIVEDDNNDDTPLVRGETSVD
jgi:hypothetical protein